MRATIVIACTAAISAVLTSPALAAPTGEGVAGESNDKVVTFASLAVVLGFIALVVVASAIQGRLEHRKEERKAARAAQRIGW